MSCTTVRSFNRAINGRNRSRCSPFSYSPSGALQHQPPGQQQGTIQIDHRPCTQVWLQHPPSWVAHSFVKAQSRLCHAPHRGRGTSLQLVSQKEAENQDELPGTAEEVMHMGEMMHLLEVATRTRPRSHIWLNRRLSIVASATSVTKNSSRHSTRMSAMSCAAT